MRSGNSITLDFVENGLSARRRSASTQRSKELTRSVRESNDRLFPGINCCRRATLPHNLSDRNCMTGADVTSARTSCRPLSIQLVVDTRHSVSGDASFENGCLRATRITFSTVSTDAYKAGAKHNDNTDGCDFFRGPGFDDAAL